MHFEGAHYPEAQKLVVIPSEEAIAVGARRKSPAHFESRATEHAASHGKVLVCNGNTLEYVDGNTARRRL